MERFTHAGLTFDVRDEGPADGPAVVLLHGFPQDGGAYEGVVPPLAAAGLRVLVPDQRGYSPGARPPGRAAYAVPDLVADVVALLDAAGADRAVVVGHDWGGAVAWTLAARHPDRVAALVALSTPHPRALGRATAAGSQALRSSYMAAFQVPVLPERLLLAHDGARLRSTLRHGGLPDALADRYVRRMAEPGALTAALGWYRALAVRPPGPVPPVRVPTTYLHGLHDPFFSPTAVRATRGLVAAPYRRVPLAASHWVPETRPEAVAEAVLSAAGHLPGWSGARGG